MSSKPVIVTCAIFFLSISGILCYDWCRISGCRDPSKHVLCLYEPGKFGDTCGREIVKSGLNLTEIDDVVATHEGWKKIFDNYKPLTWDMSLQYVAQVWANQCKNYTDECRSLPHYKTVYQLVDKRKDDTHLIKMVRDWFWSLTDPRNRDEHGMHVIDRIGCGFIETNEYHCRNKYVVLLGTLGTQCSKTFSRYLVCNYAVSSEDSDIPTVTPLHRHEFR